MEQRPNDTSFSIGAWSKRLDEAKRRAYKGDTTVLPELDRIIAEGENALTAKEAS